MGSRILGETFGGGSFIFFIFIVTMFEKKILRQKKGVNSTKKVSLTGSEFGYVFACI